MEPRALPLLTVLLVVWGTCNVLVSGEPIAAASSAPDGYGADEGTCIGPNDSGSCPSPTSAQPHAQSDKTSCPAEYTSSQGSDAAASDGADAGADADAVPSAAVTIPASDSQVDAQLPAPPSPVDAEGTAAAPTSEAGSSTQALPVANAPGDTTSSSAPPAAGSAEPSAARQDPVRPVGVPDTDAAQLLAAERDAAAATLASTQRAFAEGVSNVAALLQSAQSAVAALQQAVHQQEQRVLQLQEAAAAAAALGAAAGDPGVSGLTVEEVMRRVQQLRQALGAVAAIPGPGVTPTAAPGALGAPRRPGLATRGGARSSWFEHFALRALVRTEARLTCLFAYETPANGGTLHYIVAGSETGMLYLFSPQGDLLAEHPTGSASPVTACTAYHERKHESVVVTGHMDGETRSHGVQEAPTSTAALNTPPGAAGAAAQAPGDGAVAQRQAPEPGVAAIGAISPGPVIRNVYVRAVVDSMPAGARAWADEETGDMIPFAAAKEVPGEESEGGAAALGPAAPIMHLMPFKLGNKPTGRRQLLVVDRAGNLRVDRDNGTLRYHAATNRTQLALRMVGNFAVMLSAHHATVLNTLQIRAPKAYTCHHLNGTHLVAAAFDAHRTFRAFGIGAGGELLSLVTPHEGRISTCKVHRSTPVPQLEAQLPLLHTSTVALTPLRGYVVVSSRSSHTLLNVTGLVKAGPLELVSEQADSMAAQAAHVALGDAAAALPPMRPGVPLLAVGPASQVLIVGLDLAPATSPQPQQDGSSSGTGKGAAAGEGGDGLMVVLDSHLPKVAPIGQPTKLWSQPIFIIAMLLVGLYQFWRMSRTPTRFGGARDQERVSGARGMYGSDRYGSGRTPLAPRSALRRARMEGRAASSGY